MEVPIDISVFTVVNSNRSDHMGGRVKEICMALGATHWNWRWDVSSYVYNWILTHITATFGYQAASANTYYNHPISWWQFSHRPLDDVSVDFWGPWGRDSAIDYDVGEELINFVWWDPNPPWIRYYIWQGVLWACPVPGASEQCYWQYYGVNDETDDMHLRHVHFTFW